MKYIARTVESDKQEHTHVPTAQTAGKRVAVLGFWAQSHVLGFRVFWSVAAPQPTHPSHLHRASQGLPNRGELATAPFIEMK
jgi:hypothetical protein